MNRKEYTIRINGVDEYISKSATLNEALTSVEKTIGRVNATTSVSTKTSKEKASALSEEEKAAAKLEATQKRIAAVGSEDNKKQIVANATLRERTREVTNQIKIEQLAEGSLARLRLEAAALNEEYARTGNATEAEAARQKELQDQLAGTRDRIRELAEGAGDYRDSVGHYEKGAEAFKKLSEGVDQTSKAGMGLAQTFLAGTHIFSLFGMESEDNAKIVQALRKALMVLSLVQGLNNNLLKQNIFQTKSSSLLEAAHTVQIRAKTAAEATSTKGTVLATAAQKVFNYVAAMNPYILLAVALVTVVGALALFALNTETAAEKQERMNKVQAAELEILARRTQNVTRSANERVAALEREISILAAQGDKKKEIRRLEDQIAIERAAAFESEKRINADALKNYERNRIAAEKLTVKIAELKKAMEEDPKMRVEITWTSKLYLQK